MGSGWTLISAGACEGVTGSAHLLASGGRRVLIDAGMFQGTDEALNTRPWPFDVRDINAVILTHGHLDHVGRLPKLIRDGYRGRIHATEATMAVAEVILRDAARLQQEDVERTRRRLRRAGRSDRHLEPLYTEADVERTLAHMEPLGFGEVLNLGRGVHAQLGRAGHILGAAWVVLEGPHGSVLASGDLGDDDGPLHPPPESPPRVDALLLESTYADRHHRDAAATRAEFAEVVGKTLRCGGNVLIPTFALERTQSVLLTLQALEREGAIPTAPVILDAPMGTRMTELYRRHPDTLRAALAGRLSAGEDPFAPEALRIARSRADSMRCNTEQGVVILAGSGMMNGGRILHHLKHHLWEARNALVVVGYQAAGTLGRQIVDGASRVRINGETVAVAAALHTINGFSAHADARALDAFRSAAGAGGTDPCAQLVPVHGEEHGRTALATRAAAEGVRVQSAHIGEVLTL